MMNIPYSIVLTIVSTIANVFGFKDNPQALTNHFLQNTNDFATAFAHKSQPSTTIEVFAQAFYGYRMLEFVPSEYMNDAKLYQLGKVIKTINSVYNIMNRLGNKSKNGHIVADFCNRLKIAEQQQALQKTQQGYTPQVNLTGGMPSVLGGHRSLLDDGSEFSFEPPAPKQTPTQPTTTQVRAQQEPIVEPTFKTRSVLMKVFVCDEDVDNDIRADMPFELKCLKAANKIDSPSLFTTRSETYLPVSHSSVKVCDEIISNLKRFLEKIEINYFEDADEHLQEIKRLDPSFYNWLVGEFDSALFNILESSYPEVFAMVLDRKVFIGLDTHGLFAIANSFTATQEGINAIDCIETVINLILGNHFFQETRDDLLNIPLDETEQSDGSKESSPEILTTVEKMYSLSDCVVLLLPYSTAYQYPTRSLLASDPENPGIGLIDINGLIAQAFRKRPEAKVLTIYTKFGQSFKAYNKVDMKTALVFIK